MAEAEIPKEVLLRKLLKMTTSSNDGECLTAIRKANDLLRAGGWDWDKLLDGKIKIVENPFKGLGNPITGERPAPPVRQQPPQPKPAQQFGPAPRPTASAGIGRKWQYNAHTDQWDSVIDHSAPPPNPPRPKAGHNLTRGNNYSGHCWACGDYVGVQNGYIAKACDLNPSAPDKWATICDPCNKSGRYVGPRAATRNTGQTTVNAPAPNLGNL